MKNEIAVVGIWLSVSIMGISMAIGGAQGDDWGVLAVISFMALIATFFVSGE